ncbi:hypothetical protein GCM10022267_37890 [Lentzea roselyniae]|uniref:Uncharacterized protein n=1 Tax=Lentzea roselyniae TaxID=531940 RepID=A0ABP7B4L0_9PSEU
MNPHAWQARNIRVFMWLWIARRQIRGLIELVGVDVLGVGLDSASVALLECQALELVATKPQWKAL